MMLYYIFKKKVKRIRRLDRIKSEKKKEKRMRPDSIKSEKKKEKRTRSFDRINSVLPDELMMEIFRCLELEQDREALSLVCKRWLNLERISRKTICISFTEGTDTLLKHLAERCTNVHKVSIDEFHKSNPIRVGTRFINRFLCVNEFPLTNKIEPNEMRKYCLSDSRLAASEKGFTKLASLVLIGCPNITDAGLTSVAEKCRLLKSLDLQVCCVGDKSLVAIGKYCSRLEALNLEDCGNVTDVGLVQFALHCGRTLMSLGIRGCRGLTDVSFEAVGFHCTSLQTLLIVSESINDKGLLSIAKGCSLLKSLNIQCENITDESVQVVGRLCLVLEVLALNCCSKLTDRSLYAIGKGCKKLKTLCIQMCYSLSELGFDSIAHGCEELIHLEVDCLSIGLTGLKFIGNLACTHLSELVLQNLECQQLDHNVLHEIGIGVKHLKSLHLIRLDIPKETLHGIFRLFRNLKKLYISGCGQVGNKEMIIIGESHKFLSDLTINQCSRVGDGGIIAIARSCPQLSFLDIRGLTKVGDRGMVALSQSCPLLKDLRISGCREITDQTLNYVAMSCELLESCDMKSCSGITKFGVKTFITRCQNLKKIGVEDWKLCYIYMENEWASSNALKNLVSR